MTTSFHRHHHFRRHRDTECLSRTTEPSPPIATGTWQVLSALGPDTPSHEAAVIALDDAEDVRQL